MCRAGGRGGEGKTGSFLVNLLNFFPVIIYVVGSYVLNEFIEYILLNVLCSFVQQNIDE